MKWVHPGIRTILLVEPDDQTILSVSAVLGPAFRTLAARSGHEAIGQLSRSEPSLALVAFTLPDMVGLGLCRHLRTLPVSPVIFVSGRDSEADALASYAAGADSYIVKPYRLRELDARIQAALRRAPSTARDESRAVTVGDVMLSPDSHEVRVRDRVVDLPLREFELLSVLLTHPGKIWSREALMRRVWGETPPSGTKSLDVHVRRIRGRIEDEPSRPSRILTVRGVGYKYAAPVANGAQADERSPHDPSATTTFRSAGPVTQPRTYRMAGRTRDGGPD